MVRIVRSHTSYTEGVVLSLEASSPDRVNPFCPDFGRCGGCSMQHMSYPAQLVWKRKLVVDALTRIGKVTDAESLSQPTLGMEDPMYSRYKVALPVRPEGIGFFARSSHTGDPFLPTVKSSIPRYCGPEGGSGLDGTRRDPGLR
jgi:23S rRNA (uracil1939-C5)-methyltransferase